MNKHYVVRLGGDNGEHGERVPPAIRFSWCVEPVAVFIVHASHAKWLGWLRAHFSQYASFHRQRSPGKKLVWLSILAIAPFTSCSIFINTRIIYASHNYYLSDFSIYWPPLSVRSSHIYTGAVLLQRHPNVDRSICRSIWDYKWDEPFGQIRIGECFAGVAGAWLPNASCDADAPTNEKLSWIYLWTAKTTLKRKYSVSWTCRACVCVCVCGLLHLNAFSFIFFRVSRCFYFIFYSQRK